MKHIGFSVRQSPEKKRPPHLLRELLTPIDPRKRKVSKLKKVFFNLARVKNASTILENDLMCFFVFFQTLRGNVTWKPRQKKNPDKGMFNW